MLFCAKCGVENLDEVSHCSNCGEPMGLNRREGRNWEDEIEERAEEFGERAERFGRRMSNCNWEMEDECYGGRNRSTGPIIFG